MRPRAAWVAVAALGVALALPSASGAWRYKFQDFFDAQGGAVAAAVATAKKCGPGGRLGTYDYVSRVASISEAGELEVEVRADLSVREVFKRMKNIEVSTQATPNFDPSIVQQAADALLDYHQTVFTKYKGGKHPKLLIRHGEMVIFGYVAVEAGESKTKFDPKPGC